uniref:Timeless n=1 Tax=Euphausia superba TaxID=6819 RepID=A0A286Q182_EUPSU|nr:timeless [Euphausia superba]
MEWMMMNMDRFYAPAVQLGNYYGDKYVPSKNYKAKIDEILRRLVQDKARWHFRRSLFMNKIISQNLLPTLTHVKEDREVLEATVKVLQELMTPVECLIPMETMSRNCEGRRIIQELESSIMLHKKMFLDTRVTKAIVDLMGSTLQDSKKVLSMAECECINHCLLLVRNLLHVSNNSLVQEQQQKQRQQNHNQKSEAGMNNGSASVLLEDQIMWNLFAQRFDNILIQIFTSHQQHLWNITIVQLISLMYREQKQENIRNMINEWLDSSLSESSEDDENNTMSSSSDNISTSDPVSETSERLLPVNEPIKLKINKQTSTSSSTINSEESQAITNKTQSAADSGFCSSFQPSGSNQDSNEETTIQVSCLHKQQSQITKPADQGNEDKTDLNIEDLQFKDTAQKENQTNLVLAIEEEVRSCGVNEGGTEGSSLLHTLDDTTPLSCQRLEIEKANEIKEVTQIISMLEDGSKGETAANAPVSLEMAIEQTKLAIEQTKLAIEQTKLQQNTNLGKGGLNQLAQQDMSINNQFNMSACTIKTTPTDTNFTSPCVLQNLAQSELFRRPPNETEADSDDNKPPPQLPKLTKKNPGSGTKRSRHSMSQIMSENQENEYSNSTGSDYDEGPACKRPHHQKPHKMLSKPRPAKMMQKAIQERNVKRTKLLRHKENYSIKAKALLHHHPTSEDITNLLKEFTVDFMLKGYANLLEGLRLQVLMPYQIDLDKSHVLWLITYFIRFAVELDLELSILCPVLSVETVSYLVYEGVVMQEELERATHNGEANLQPHIRRLHLVVTALREFFLAFEICMKKDPATYDSQQLLKIKEDLGQLVEVRQLFVLLIRTYKPGVLNLNYLQDLITTNHRFLTTQEAASPTLSTLNTFDIFDHVKQFCTSEIMRQYGRLLENFENNDEQVNDCIFTMMHHTVGDLRSINCLMQPQILKIFLKIWNEGFDLCVDWSDLIEYVLRKCTIVRTESRKRDAIKNESEKMQMMNTGIELTDEDLDHWYSLYSVQENEADLMYKIKEVCCDDSIEEPVKKEVIQKLLARGFITSIECTKLCAEIPIIVERKSVTSVSLNSDHMQVSITDIETLSTGTQDPEDSLPAPKKCPEEVKDNPTRFRSMPEPIKDLAMCGVDTDFESSQPFDREDPWDDNTNVIGFINKLKEEGLGAHVEWLQGQLLEACYAKLKILGPDLPRAEPIASHFTISNQSIPLIPWSLDQDVVLSNPWFRQLLGALGLHQPNDTGKVFPRIPHFWTPDVLFLMAKRLGDIDSRSLTSLLWIKAQHVWSSLITHSQAENRSACAPWKTIDQPTPAPAHLH